MKYFLPLFIAIPSLLPAQKKFDSKVIVTEVDTIGLFERVKINFGKAGYLVLHDGNTDTITTYPKEIKTLGFIQLKALVRDDTVTFFGHYNRKTANAVGYTVTSGHREPILYYGKSGKGWKILMKLASMLKGKIMYAD